MIANQYSRHRSSLSTPIIWFCRRVQGSGYIAGSGSRSCGREVDYQCCKDWWLGLPTGEH